jgi:hypothetical protein
MKVTINRNFCGHHPAGCEQCFGEFLRHGAVPDRSCITNVEEDGRPEISVDITSGRYTSTLVVTDENREQVIYDGWIKFVDLPPEAFEIVPPHGADVRRMVHELEDKS